MFHALNIPSEVSGEIRKSVFLTSTSPLRLLLKLCLWRRICLKRESLAPAGQFLVPYFKRL